FLVDLELKLDLSEAGETDDLEKTVNYGEVFEIVKEIMEGEPVQLIEHLAERIAKQLFSHYNRVLETKVKITKDNPPIPGQYNGVGIEIVRKRSMHTAYLGLGSNIGERERQLEQAVTFLNSEEGIKVPQVSPIYETKPVGYTEQPDFLNMCIEISTE